MLHDSFSEPTKCCLRIIVAVTSYCYRYCYSWRNPAGQTCRGSFIRNTKRKNQNGRKVSNHQMSWGMRLKSDYKLSFWICIFPGNILRS